MYANTNYKYKPYGAKKQTIEKMSNKFKIYDIGMEAKNKRKFIKKLFKKINLESGYEDASGYKYKSI